MAVSYFIYGIILFSLGVLAGILLVKQRRKEESNKFQENDVPEIPNRRETAHEVADKGGEISEKRMRSITNKDQILLIVEDNVDMNNFISEQFEHEFEILQAFNGLQGINMAIENIPDLIISDLMMPRKNGLELCQTLKQTDITCHIPIILLTAKATVENRIEGLETGADDYIAKPYNPDELAIRARNLIEQRKKLQEKFSNTLQLGPKKIDVQSADINFLRQLMFLIEENLASDILGVEYLSDKLGISRSQLYRKIKALTGDSINILIRDFRLKRAEELIKQNYGSVSEIAFEVGFNNLSYFSRSFREKYGKLPSEY